MRSLPSLYYADSRYNVRYILPVRQNVVWSILLALEELTGPAGLDLTHMNCWRHLCELCLVRIAAEADVFRVCVLQDFD